MPRKTLLTTSERESIIALPKTVDDLIRFYSFNETDVSLIEQRRGQANRLGFAFHLCILRYPGIALIDKISQQEPIIQWLASQIGVNADEWANYAIRQETRIEHIQEICSYLEMSPFSLSSYRFLLHSLTEIAQQTDKGIVLAEQAIDILRKQKIIIPLIPVIERACSEAISSANKQIYKSLTRPLTKTHRRRLDKLLDLKPGQPLTWLSWLRQSPVKPNSKFMLEHIDRLQTFNSLELPDSVGKNIHQNRLLKLARETGQMTPQDIGKLEKQRRYASLVALSLESIATITDEIIDLHDQIMIKLFSMAKNKHKQKFQSQGKEINEKVRLYSIIGHALMEAKQKGIDPYEAIESVISWDEFSKSISEADQLAQSESFDHLFLVVEQYSTLRRYTPTFLNALNLTAAPGAHGILEAIEVIKGMNDAGLRKIPETAPTSFVKSRWENLVFTESRIDRRYYEICALSELKHSLRSGDIWVQGSRQYREFDEYLISKNRFEEILQKNELPIVIEYDCEAYLQSRMATLEKELSEVNQMALNDELPDAVLNDKGLKLTPLETIVPENAQKLIDLTSHMLPRLKITDLLMEVDDWTGFSRHFIHLKDGEPAKDRILLLTVILADAINLGLNKMAESCPGMTYKKLSWLQAWHIRDETYSAALAELVNAQFHHAFAGYWGDGTTSSSDGQRFRVGGKAESTGHINPKYGSEPGKLFYTHISDQYAPFSSKVINVGVRDSTYVLDGLLYHESDLKIEEHYTDTAGFTDHVFALMHLLGFKFAPRIRDLKDTKLYIPRNGPVYQALKTMVGGTINVKQIREHWNEILRLAASIKNGTVTASLMLRKLGSYPRQNGLAVALRELGRIERTLFILEWLKDPDLRRRVHVGLNKGEAKHALARAIYFNRLGEIRDRSFEHQRYRASGLNLVTAAIVLWNTVYLERTIEYLRKSGQNIDESLLQYLSPLGWEHINLTGDYVWNTNKQLKNGEYRSLRMLNSFL